MKKIIICCDGTWNTPEKDITNITRMARAISPTGHQGIPQVVFYDWGVGSEGKVEKITGGALGEGIDKNIMDAYRFIVHNFTKGDELYFFGFSRGAYTVRSLVGFIRNCGVLKKKNVGKIPLAYKMYRNRSTPKSKVATHFRATNSHETKVKFLGVYDTVGALGIPINWLKWVEGDKYAFHDTRISGIVENAYHAVAIDEFRDDFAPTLWRTKQDYTNSKQVWFSGCHSDIGGGYRETGLSDLALLWMMKQIKPFLKFDQSYLKNLTTPPGKPTLHNSYTGAFKALGKHIRPLCTTSPDEDIHPSAQKKFTKEAKYTPKNLQEFYKSK